MADVPTPSYPCECVSAERNEGKPSRWCATCAGTGITSVPPRRRDAAPGMALRDRAAREGWPA